jgi:hypothetical protein
VGLKSQTYLQGYLAIFSIKSDLSDQKTILLNNSKNLSFSIIITKKAVDCKANQAAKKHFLFLKSKKRMIYDYPDLLQSYAFLVFKRVWSAG